MYLGPFPLPSQPLSMSVPFLPLWCPDHLESVPPPGRLQTDLPQKLPCALSHPFSIADAH